MRQLRRRLFPLLVAAFATAAPAAAQQTTPTTVPTVAETQTFTLTVPAPPPGARPAPVALPNRSLPQPASGPLPRQLAYTGSNPLPLIAAGLAIAGLSLLARRWTRARLRARAGG